MISKNINLNIIPRVLIIVVTTFFAFLGYFHVSKFNFAITGAILIGVETFLLIRYLNTTNRQLAAYVNAIKNDDTSFRFPASTKHGAVADLQSSLESLNKVLQEKKLEIARHEQLLQTLIENSSAGFLTIDEKGHFEVLNHPAREYLGIEYTTSMQRLKEEDPSLYQLFRTIRPGETKVHEIHKLDQHHVLSVSVSFVRFLDEKFKIVSMQDISSPMDEREIASWHNLFRVITHEIMNSIAPITSLTDTLSRLYKKNGNKVEPADVTTKTINKTLSGLKVIEEMSRGLMGFVEKYRQLNKIPIPEIKPIQIKTWIPLLKTMVEGITKDKNITPVLEVQQKCKYIMGDEKLLNQVIINLVKNSLEAMENIAGKKLTLRLSPAGEGKYTIKIIDNGTGIPPEEIDKIFVPFYSTKENGNGIGLSFSRQIIRMHGGKITVHSKEGEGTTVVIWLDGTV
jgi:nitrogen fixation/metabolism regulation signal transduction histidine kinase